MKGPGQYAGKGVAELEQQDEKQDRDRERAGEKFGEGFDRRQRDAADRIALLVDDVCGRCRLGRHQRSENADDHQPGGGDEAPHPDRLASDADIFEPCGERDHARAGCQHADAIGGDIAGHAGGLFAGIEAFDTEGVDHDVLGRGRGRHHHCAERDRP